MKKRIFSLIIAIVMITAVLSSCSGDWKGYRETDLEKFVTVGEYKNVSVDTSKYTEEVTDKEIEDYINKKLTENAVRTPITDRVSKKADYANISFTVSVGNKYWDALAANNQDLKVENSGYSEPMAGISKLLPGRKAGDAFEFTILFPDNYVNSDIENSEELAGKHVTYHITVNSIFEFVTPELTDDVVAEKLSTTSKTVDEYKAEVKEILIAEKKDENATNVRRAIWQKVIASSVIIEFPEELIKEIIDDLTAEVKYYAEAYGMGFADYIKSVMYMTEEQFNEAIEENAETVAKEYLVMYSIAKLENITVSDEEYAEKLNEYYQFYTDDFKSAAEMEAHYGKDQILETVLYDKVVEYIFSVSGVSNF